MSLFQQQLQKQGASPSLIQQAANIVMRHKLQSAELPTMGPRPRPEKAGQESAGESQDESEVNVSSEHLAGDHDGSGAEVSLSQLPASVQVSVPQAGGLLGLAVLSATQCWKTLWATATSCGNCLAPCFAYC